jgi:sulfite reductase (ferredoxin)
VPARTGDHIGVTRQKDGRYFVGVAPTVGRVDGATLVRLAEIAEEHGSRRVRTTPYQKLLVLDVEEDRVERIVAALEGIGLSARPSSWRRSTMACTGIEFCKLAIVETKQRAADLVTVLEERFPDLDVPITVNVNGCPNACARTQVADIGLKGMLVLDADGRQVEGYQVHLGGGLGLNPQFGKKLRAHKVTSAGLDDYVTNVVTAFLDQRTDDESFATWVSRADDAALRGEVGDRELEAVL